MQWLFPFVKSNYCKYFSIIYKKKNCCSHPGLQLYQLRGILFFPEWTAPGIGTPFLSLVNKRILSVLSAPLSAGQMSGSNLTDKATSVSKDRSCFQTLFRVCVPTFQPYRGAKPWFNVTLKYSLNFRMYESVCNQDNKHPLTGGPVKLSQP